MFLGVNELINKENMTVRLGAALLLAALLSACGGETKDQTIPDYAIAYIKRPIETETVTVTVQINGVDTDVNIEQPVDTDMREATDFHEGGDVYIRERAAISAEEKNITLCITDLDGDGIGTGDVRDLETNHDGTKLIFSLRLEDFTNGNNPPKWNIYEYDTEVGGCPTRVIQDDFAADKGDDVSPAYLPDGRIVFSSNAAVTTRESLLNEGKSQFSPFDEDINEAAVVLHVMDADGSDIKQISFNQSHDLDASVLSDGKIVFSRWDGPRQRSAIRLYTIHPDGTELKALYGLHEADVGTGGSTVQFLDPRQLDDGRILAMLKPFTGSAGGGAPVLIDVANYSDINQGTVPNLGISGPGQVLAINQDVRTDGSFSPAGRYRSVYPLADGSNRALVSWSQCRMQPSDAMGLPDMTQTPLPCPGTIPAGAWEAFPLYGIYVYDFTADTQIPVVVPEEGIVIDEPVVLAPRPRPTVLIDKVVGLELDQTLAESEFVGILHIRSVYDFDGTFNALGGGAMNLADMANPTITDADARPARYLRIIKGAAIPDPDDPATEFDDGMAFGVGGRRGGMREIIGYAPIAPDGSVMTKVPANVPLSFQIVDKDGRRLSAAPRHLNWIQVRGGETLECNGCHTHTTTAPDLPIPHGYADVPTALNQGALMIAEFPGTSTDDPATAATDETIMPEMNETMAEARIRVLCTNTSGVFNKSAATCPQLSPSPDPIFFDVWSYNSPVASDTELRYSNLDPAMAAGIPVPATCTPGAIAGAKWDYTCRTIINYEDSIHPLWSLPRTNMAMVDHTCTLCHSNQDAMMAAMVPAEQLDLSDGLRQDNPDHFKAYRELLIQDDRQWQLNGTVLEFVTQPVPVIDPVTGLQVTVDDGMGNLIPQFTDEPVEPSQGPTMSANGALASFQFFDRFETPGDRHEGLLTRAEKRLLYEWLDIGAQYFNNTFDAPPP